MLTTRTQNHLDITQAVEGDQFDKGRVLFKDDTVELHIDRTAIDHAAGCGEAGVECEGNFEIFNPTDSNVFRLSLNSLTGSHLSGKLEFLTDLTGMGGEHRLECEVSNAQSDSPVAASNPSKHEQSSATAHSPQSAVNKTESESEPSAGAQTTPVASTPSFDCAKAATLIEKEICRDPVLARLDNARAQTYATVRHANFGFSSEFMGNIMQAQKTWVAERDRCADAECLRATYRKRIDELNEICDAPVVSGVHPDCVSADSVR